MTSASRRARDLAKTGLRRAFVGGQRLGVDVLPRHFYSSIPHVPELRESRVWRAPRTMVGVAGMERGDQLATLSEWFPSELQDRVRGRNIREEAARENGAKGFGPTEATILYAFIATQRPRRIVQVGAGVSTAVILSAAADHGFEVEITCVDPFPTDYLVELDRTGRITLIREPAQEVDLGALIALGDGDLFFVDSTHTVKPGSEVNRIVFEVLPRLAAGVRVHFHDIWFPYDYSRDLLTAAIFFWNESPLLHAFLVDNDRMRVELSCSWLHYQAPAEMAEIVPGYTPAEDDDGLDVTSIRQGHFPSSAYLRVAADATDRATAT